MRVILYDTVNLISPKKLYYLVKKFENKIEGKKKIKLT